MSNNSNKPKLKDYSVVNVLKFIIGLSMLLIALFYLGVNMFELGLSFPFDVLTTIVSCVSAFYILFSIFYGKSKLIVFTAIALLLVIVGSFTFLKKEDIDIIEAFCTLSGFGLSILVEVTDKGLLKKRQANNDENEQGKQ